MDCKQLKSQSGDIVVQVLIAIALTGILAAAMSSMVTTQSIEAGAAKQKLMAVDFQRLLAGALFDGAVCAHMTAGLTFNGALVVAGTPQTLTPVSPIYASLPSASSPGAILAQVGEPISVYSPELVVNNIRLVIDEAPPIPGDTQFKGYWEVGFESAPLIRPLAPIRVPTSLTTNTGNTALPMSIVQCNKENAPKVSGLVHGGSWCHPWFFGACTGWNSWGYGCGDADHDKRMTSYVMAGPTGQICITK